VIGLLSPNFELQMKFVAIPILIILIMSQCFNHWFVVMGFKMNQEYIAKNTCINRFRPKLHCNGNCVLMKKLREQEKDEKNGPAALKLDVTSIVISSRSFFAALDEKLVATAPKAYLPLFNTGRPVNRSSSVFHPPSVG
jgi:hypothetical protein